MPLPIWNPVMPTIILENLHPQIPIKYLIKNQKHTNQQQTPRQATLFGWIKPKLPHQMNNNNSNPKTAMNNNNQTNMHHKKQNSPPLCRHNQQTLSQLPDNNHCSDPLSTSPRLFHVASKNVNIISPADNLLQWHGIAHAMFHQRAEKCKP